LENKDARARYGILKEPRQPTPKAPWLNGNSQRPARRADVAVQCRNDRRPARRASGGRTDPGRPARTDRGGRDTYKEDPVKGSSLGVLLPQNGTEVPGFVALPPGGRNLRQGVQRGNRIASASTGSCPHPMWARQ